MKTVIKKTPLGHQVKFTIGNQTFSLQEEIEDDETDSFRRAKWYEEMLLKAFEKLEYKTEAKSKELRLSE
jgi:hypothetical protein